MTKTKNARTASASSPARRGLELGPTAEAAAAAEAAALDVEDLDEAAASKVRHGRPGEAGPAAQVDGNSEEVNKAAAGRGEAQVSIEAKRTVLPV